MIHAITCTMVPDSMSAMRARRCIDCGREPKLYYTDCLKCHARYCEECSIAEHVSTHKDKDKEEPDSE